MQHHTSQKGAVSAALIGAIVLIIAAIVGLSVFSSQSRQTEAAMETGAGAMHDNAMGADTIKADTPTMGDSMMEEDGGTMMKQYTGTVFAGTSAPLLDFTKADYDTAVQSGKLVVLFFYASWCPICKAEYPQAQAAFNALDTDQVVGFRVNYKDDDTDKDEEALARQFGVPYQHTKVFLKNGEQVLKAPDQWDAARYTTEIQKALAR